MNAKQKALLELNATQELARITGLTPEEVLDVVIPNWREIQEWSYSETVAWGHAFALREELKRAK